MVQFPGELQTWFARALGLEQGSRMCCTLSSLRGVRVEQSNLINWKKKGVVICCSYQLEPEVSTSTDQVPTSQSGKVILEEAGLGEKMVTVPDLSRSV